MSAQVSNVGQTVRERRYLQGQAREQAERDIRDSIAQLLPAIELKRKKSFTGSKLDGYVLTMGKMMVAAEACGGDIWSTYTAFREIKNSLYVYHPGYNKYFLRSGVEEAYQDGIDVLQSMMKYLGKGTNADHITGLILQ